MTNKTIEAIQRAKAYVHYKRLEKDQSEDNQCMANDLALILEALQDAENDYKDMRKFQAEFMRVDHELRDLKETIKAERQRTMPSHDKYIEWLMGCLSNDTPPNVAEIYNWIKRNLE